MLYSIQICDFAAATSISRILQNYQCSTIEHLDKNSGCERDGQKVKAILSARFEKEIGGLKNIIELIKKRGAKSLVIIEENANNFSVERSMNGALLRVALPKTNHSLEKQFFLIDKDVDVIGTQMDYIDEAGMPIGGAPLLPTSNNDIIHSVLYKKENPICNSSVIYRKAIHTDIVGFYDPLCVVEDYDMWSRCAFSGLRFANHPERLVHHRIHEASNFNSSQRQALHKNLIDGRNEAWQKIETICRSST